MTLFEIREINPKSYALRVNGEPRGIYSSREDATFYGDLYTSMERMQRLMTVAASAAPADARYWYVQVPNGLWAYFDMGKLSIYDEDKPYVLGFVGTEEEALYWVKLHESAWRDVLEGDDR